MPGAEAARVAGEVPDTAADEQAVEGIFGMMAIFVIVALFLAFQFGRWYGIKESYFEELKRHAVIEEHVTFWEWILD